MQNGLELDQTVAIPTKPASNAIAMTANFFMRTAVEEVQTGRLGAIEVPVEWVKPLLTKNASVDAPSGR